MAIALWLSNKQVSGSDYFVASRKGHPFPIALSVLATQCSTNSVLGAPAFVAFTSGGGLVWLQYELAVPLAMIFTMVFIIPVFQSQKLVSVYEYLENRFDLQTRLLLSGVFQTLRVFAAAITIYGVSAMIDLITGIGFFESVCIFGVFTIVYDVLGGIRAVIWSDVLQMLILVIVLVYLLHILTSDAGGFIAMLASVPSDRLNAIVFSSNGFGDGEDFAFWPMLFGGFFLYVSYYGCDQSQVQRQLCASSQEDGQKILCLNGLLRFPLVLIYCLIGVGIASYAQSNDDFIHLLAHNDGVPNFNLALPVMFLLELPEGLKGLAVVGVIAAAMSSLDSVINSLSAVTMEDFIKRLKVVDLSSGYSEIGFSKLVTAIWGVLALSLSFVVDDIASNVLIAVNKIGSVVNGPLLAVFVLGLLTRQASGLGVRLGFLAGLLANLTMWIFVPKLSWLWWNVIGFFVAASVGLIIARDIRGSRSTNSSTWSMSLLAEAGLNLMWVTRYTSLLVFSLLLILMLVVIGIG